MDMIFQIKCVLFCSKACKPCYRIFRAFGSLFLLGLLPPPFSAEILFILAIFSISQLRTEMASTSQTNYILWAVLSEPGSTLRISDGEKERDMNYSAATRDDWTDYRSIKSTLFSHHYV